eukprot:Gb_02904 [translate_table: standard]
MSVTKMHRTPLKARTQSPARVLLNANDDESERAQVRAARAAANRRKSFLGNEGENGRTRSIASQIRDEDLLGKDQILDLFQNCIRLASENKINQRNTWELSLIDHLSDIIKVEDDDTETNFQKASCTLEAGVKIYSLRVDSVHTDAYKVLGGINRTGTGDKEKNEEGENGDAEEERDDAKMDSQKKIAAPSATLEPSLEALNVKKFDVAFAVDPLYHQTSAQFDEGGAKGLLLNTLSVYNDCRIVFDSWDVPGKSMKSGLIQNRDSSAIINLSCIKDCVEQMIIGMQTRREISPTLHEILKSFDDPYRSAAEAIAATRNEDDTLDSSLDNPESFDAEDEVFDDVGPQDFDCDEHGGVFEDGLTSTSPDSVSCGSVVPERQNLEDSLGYGEVDYQAGRDALSERTIDFLFLGMGMPAKSNAWAGPDHWKYRKFKDSHQNSDAPNEMSSKDNKTKKRKREPFSIDFLNPLDIEKAASFAPPKNQRTLLLPQNHSSVRTTLPEDCHYQPEEFVKLFLLPSVMYIRKKGRKGSDDSIQDSSHFEPSDTWGNGDESASRWGDGYANSDVEDSNETMVVQPRKVQRIEVDYDKTSKQVDVHVLKRTLWFGLQDFCSTSNVGHEKKSEVVVSFKGLLSNMPADYPAAAPEDISVHLCFICLLHLANEHCLCIQDCSTLDELRIRIPVNSQK